jgi:hypothetical protein
VWTGFISLRIGSSGALCGHSNEPPDSVRGRKFCDHLIDSQLFKTALPMCPSRARYSCSASLLLNGCYFCVLAFTLTRLYDICPGLFQKYLMFSHRLLYDPLCFSENKALSNPVRRLWEVTCSKKHGWRLYLLAATCKLLTNALHTGNPE